MTLIEKLRRKFPDLTDRGLQGKWLKKKHCPKCEVKGRLLPGSDQPGDRWKITCLNCGARFRIPTPKGFSN